MEFRGIYILWGLLPFGYICFTIWVYLRTVFKVSGKEKVAHYFPSLLWTLGCYVLTLIIDQFGVVEAIFSLFVSLGIFGGDLQVEILRFLLYPAVLLIVAEIQKFITGENSDRKRNLPKSRWR